MKYLYKLFELIILSLLTVSYVNGPVLSNPIQSEKCI